MREFRDQPLALYRRTWQEHGDIARIRAFPGIYVYFLVHPDAVEHVLVRNHLNYRKPDFFNDNVGELSGNGLITSEGDTWRTQRKLVQPAFHRDRLAGLGEVMVEATESLVREWERGEPGRRLDILPEMMRLSLRIAGLTLFGADISGEADAIGTAFRTAFAHIGRRMNGPQAPRWLPTAENRRFKAAKGLLDRVVQDMIDNRRKETRGTQRPARDAAGRAGRGDRARDVGPAGEGRGPHAADGGARDRRCRAVVDVVPAGPASRDPGGPLRRGPRQASGTQPDRGRPARAAADPGGLRGGAAALPPAPGQPRVAIGDDTIGGHRIPAKSTVMVCQYMTHRHPAFWDDPERFDPTRFLPGRAAGRPKFAYYPFGGGPRTCVGNHFALMEATLILATIAQRFRVELVPGQSIVPDTTFTLRPRPGVEVTLWPR